ncbi:MAG: hypothetical protein WC695_00055 [Candidatus Omnitrophota bacterium]
MRKYALIWGLLVLVVIASGCAETIVYKRAGALPPPPPLREEIIIAQPFPATRWVSGHWAWRGRRRGYVWVPGHWRNVY